MQLMPRRRMYGPGNQSWLGSRHATDNARSVTVDVTKLTAFAEKGVLPSGTPLKKSASGGLYEPVTEAGDQLAGFVLTDQSFTSTAGNVIVALLDHGRINAARLPQGAFDITTLTTPNPAFVIIPGGDN